MRLALVCAVSVSAFLSACGGGGGGGGGGGSATLSPFVRFSALAIPGTTRINGYSQEATYTYNVGTQRVTSLSAASASQGGAIYDGTLDSSGNFTKGVWTSARGTQIVIDRSRGDTVSSVGNVTLAVTANGQNSVWTLSPSFYGWDYQSFGIWTTGGGTGSGTVGAVSVGAETSASAIPAAGTATFTGLTLSHYVDAAGVPYYSTADLSATANFSTRSISFATTNSGTLNQNTLVQATNANLNMSGTLTYAAGSNQFTGPVTTIGGGPGNAAMTGTATGRFYGPTAQEIGGTFGVSNGSAAMLGAFGGKR